MKRVFVFAVLALTGAAFASEVIETNEYIVKTHNIPALESFVAEHNLTIEPLINYPNPSQEVLDYTRGSYVVSFGMVEQEVADSLVGVLTTLEGMQYVEPNSVIQIEPVEQEDAQMFNMPDSFPWPYTPNDPMYSQEWDDQAMRLNWVWNLTTGGDVKVGIIDTGVDPDHENLKNNINFDLSYNFYNDNTNLDDTYGHGVDVCGVACAEIDNSLGIASGNFDLCVLKCDKSGGISISAAEEALYYAVDNGIEVVNMSFGDYTYRQSLADATLYAYNNGCFLCAAVGNDGINEPNDYPPAYEGVMAVGAVNSSLQRRHSSNYGSWVDIYAPGEKVLTTYNGSNYDESSGTSIASPQIAKFAAYLIAENPSWTPDQVRSQIINTADTITIDKGKVLFPNAMAAFGIDSVGIAEIETRGLNPLLNPLSVSPIGREFTLSYSVPAATPYTLSIYDVTGRGVHNQLGQLAGSGNITCTPTLTQGVYFWRVEAEGVAESGKFVWVR